jgi:hypothetical protein
MAGKDMQGLEERKRERRKGWFSYTKLVLRYVNIYITHIY